MIADRSLEYGMAVREAVTHAFKAEGFRFDEGAAIGARERLMEDGSRIWLDLTASTDLERFYRALPESGVSPLALPRILGFGYEQALALSRVIVGTEESYAAETAALLNLGIVFYDVICDRLPELRKDLEAEFEPSVLARIMVDGNVRPSSEHALIQFLRSVVGAYFRRLNLAQASSDFMTALTSCLSDMYRAEMKLLSSHSWRQAQFKSVLPMWAMALCCARVSSDALSRALAVRPRLLSAGRVLWIIDDLVDAEEDLVDGASNRVWMLAERAGIQTTIDAVSRSGIIVDEARRLARSLRKSPFECHAVLVETCRSWLSALPS